LGRKKKRPPSGDLQIARARRQRNAITHGARAVPEALETVEPFLDRVAGLLIGASVRRFDERRELSPASSSS
jgi:hypothetical protein